MVGVADPEFWSVCRLVGVVDPDFSVGRLVGVVDPDLSLETAFLVCLELFDLLDGRGWALVLP